MNTEAIPPLPPAPSVSTEETHPLSLPHFLSSSSTSSKPLRERNRTNLKRRIHLSRSQVLSNDFENEDNLPTTNNTNKTTTITTTTTTTITNSRLPSTPNLHTHTELYSKTISPTTPSPIHTTVTCSQVWERLASNEEHHNSTSPKPNTTPTISTSSLPTHISFSYDPSDDDDDEDGEHLIRTDKDDFQYVPVSSQSKLVQFQFLTFARQQQLDFNKDDDNGDNEKKHVVDSDDDDDEEQDTLISQNMEEDDEQGGEEEQENRASKKRKRSVSTTDSLDDIPAISTTTDDATASSSVTNPPRTKKPKLKDPNANFQRLNMRKKQFSHAKKHQFAKHKRNAFYRRTRHAGGK